MAEAESNEKNMVPGGADMFRTVYSGVSPTAAYFARKECAYVVG